MTQEELARIVKRLVSKLVEGEYEELERVSEGKRLSKEQIAGAVRDYGGRLVMPPEDVFDEIDSIAVDNSQPPQWSVCFDLWTQLEGQSDLSLELTIRETKLGQFEVELDNLHVL